MVWLPAPRHFAAKLVAGGFFYFWGRRKLSVAKSANVGTEVGNIQSKIVSV
jgi:hypothetical protein